MSAPNSIGRCKAGDGEGIVDDQPRAALMRDLRHGLEIDDRKRRVRRRFQKQHFRFRAHRGFPLIDIAAIDKRAGDAEARQNIFHHIAAGAEHRLRADHMIAGCAARTGTSPSPPPCRSRWRVRRARLRARPCAPRTSTPSDWNSAYRLKPSPPLKRASASSAVLIGIARGEEQRLRGFLKLRAHLAGRARPWCARAIFCPVSCSLPCTWSCPEQLPRLAGPVKPHKVARPQGCV